ncbi:MAG: hypothetical protein F4X97_06635 [Boseongicola sp. SB0662_bin_57]|nr:hypothetical protein [Boseongicola sp. SB0662_bin_57]
MTLIASPPSLTHGTSQHAHVGRWPAGTGTGSGKQEKGRRTGVLAGRPATWSTLDLFRTNRRHLHYADAAAAGYAAGSGSVESANRILVTSRIKRSGQSWGRDGGQGVRTFRSLLKSGRFDRAWAALAPSLSRSDGWKPSQSANENAPVAHVALRVSAQIVDIALPRSSAGRSVKLPFRVLRRVSLSSTYRNLLDVPALLKGECAKCCVRCEFLRQQL